MNRYYRFTTGLQLDLKGFIWFSMLFTFFRFLFIWWFSSQLPDGTTNSDWWLTLWYGFRLSLKTVGIIVLAGFIGATVPETIYRNWPGVRIRHWIYMAASMVFTILFFVRLSYYEIFNSGFNMMLINGMKDDWYAILMTGIHEYGLLWKLPLAILVGLGITWCCVKFVNNTTKIYRYTDRKDLCKKSLILAVVISVVAVLCRFGGALNYEKSVNWENAARLPSNLLNEAILDDAQALYRVYSIERRRQNAMKILFSREELKQKISLLGGNAKASTIDAAFSHTIKETRLAKQPNTVVMVLGESYALWPFTEKYNHPGEYLVEQGRALIVSPNSMHTDVMLAQGTGTMPAVNGFLTGLVDIGVYPNYEKESYRHLYGTGIANVMKPLGYKTVFWYGGFGTWQDVRQFSLAQGFDEFYDAASLPQKGSNAWGVPDKSLFDGILEYMKAHPGEKVFHFVLTTSNHPPYSIDLGEAGFNPLKVKLNDTDTIERTRDTMREMGHIWYADHTMGVFVKAVEGIDANALFVITGDHAERFTFAKEVDIKTQSGIPAIFYGQGIKKEWLAPDSYGTAIQIIPTLAELVGRKGQTYESLLPSLFEPMPFAFNHRLWIDRTGLYDKQRDMPDSYKAIVSAYRDISLWRVLRGNQL